MLNFPFEWTWIIYFTFASFALALLTLLFLVLNRIRRTVRRFRRKHIRYLSITENTARFIGTLLWLFASATVLFMAAFIQSYEGFTRKELVAEVRCVPLSNGTTDSMHLELIPIRAGERLPEETFILQGDQWALEGHVLKWDDWLNFVGVHTMYKVTRVRGRYTDLESERSQPPSVFSLVGAEEDPQWRWLYQYGHKLRFVDAVYGNTVFTYPSEKNIFEIYVTTSGFIAKIKNL